MESDSEDFDQKAKKQKIPIIYNSDESEEGKSGVEEETEKKTIFVEIDSDVMPKI